jgi:carboxymethylenebutenolidase
MVCLSAFATPASANEGLAKSGFSNSSFVSHGRKIRVEWFDAVNNSKNTENIENTKNTATETSTATLPVIIILPGSGGIEPTGGFYRDLAKSIADAGTSGVIVHYLDRSNLESADSPQMSEHFSEWLATINDAVLYVCKQPHIDQKHVSVLGHSLGAQLALHVAATQPKICSVVDLAGCFVLSTRIITHMPPVLILHGGADRTVPLRRERALVAVLKGTNSRYLEHIFPRGDHAFNNVDYSQMVKLIVDWLHAL